MKQWTMRFLVLACALTGVQPAWARFVPVPCKNPYTEQKEITEGRKAAAQVYKQIPVLPDTDPLAVYVRALGARLTAYAPGYAWPYNFHVVDVEDINAFALPGGAIFVNLGTLQAAENEAQLAGVMAHEISHVVMRHSTCNIGKERNKRILFGISQVAAQVALGGVVGGTLGDMASDGIGFGQQTLFLSYSRDAEKQADLMGTDILYDAGYNPRALPQFFETIEGRYGKGGAQFLKDHPNPGNRIEYVNAEIATLPPRTDNINYTPEFTDMAKKVEAMHALTAAEIKKGAWKKDPAFAKGPDVQLPTNASPSAETGPKAATTSWLMLNDPAFVLSYPAEWTVYDGPGPGVQTVAPKDGMIPGSDGDTAVARGVVISSLPPQAGVDLATDAGLDTAADAVVKHLNIAVTSAVTPMTIGGQRARSVDMSGASPLKVAGIPEIEHDWLVVFGAKDGSARYIVFVVPEPEYLGLKPTFDAILAGFRVK
jgi:beta-barrel assembly-enhancing protease